MRRLIFSATALMVLFVSAARVDAQPADVSLALVLRDSPATADTAVTLPASASGFAIGDSLYVNLWARTTVPSGLSQVSADISFDPNQVVALGITHTTSFSLFSNGTFDNVAGLVDDLSGSVAPTSPPCATQEGFSAWTRVAEVEMAVVGSGSGVVQSSVSGSAIFVVATCGAFDPPQVEYLGVDLGTLEVATIALVSLVSPSSSDESAVLPTSVTKFLVDGPFVVEMWANTTAASGFSQASADVAFDSSAVSAVSITHTTAFSLFPNGTIDNPAGLLDDVSGSVPAVSPPCSTLVGSNSWSRVAIVDMHADSLGPFSMVPSDTGSPIFVIANCGGFVLPAAVYQGITGDLVACLVDGDCDDVNVCTNDTCDLSSNTCRFDGTNIHVFCDDGDPCTAGDQCQADQAGSCVGEETDGDGDGVPDACDPCPLDNPDDTDGDGVCDSSDVCPGGDDNVDKNGNGTPDACDARSSLSEDSLGVACANDGECANSALCIGGRCYVPKNRFVSISPEVENSFETARRISVIDTQTLETLAAIGVGESAGGIVLGWLGAPTPVDVAGPESSPKMLSRIVADPFYLNWNDVGGVAVGGTVHVGDCHVSPQHTYLIQSISLGADVNNEINFSATLPLPTVGVWADVAGATVGGVATPPNGVGNLVDAQHIVKGFQDIQTASKVWLDLRGSGDPDNVPDFSVITLVDAQLAVKSFQGDEYPFSDPCECAGLGPCP